MSQLTVVVGAQWGDEGKGKITDYLAKDADFVVRFQGGNNAGHTLVVGDKIYKLHLIPSGVLYPGAVSIIGNGVVVDPLTLLKEISEFKKDGLALNLKISNRCHVIMPYHIALDGALTGHQGGLAAGSTNRGIAPVCADKSYRHGIRLGDLLEPEMLREKLAVSYNFNKAILEKIFNTPFALSEEEIYNQFLDYGKLLAQYIDDTDVLLYRAYKEGKNILFEGAQGLSLDLDVGVYPHTTSTNTLASHIGVGTGVGYDGNKRVIGVAKAYVSRVGTSPFITELPEEEAKALRDKGGEYGTTTGRPRRVGWLDLVQLRQAVRCNGLTELALIKLDVLADYEKVLVCTSYDIDGKDTREMPASLSQLRRAKPVYQEFTGWPVIDGTALKQGGFKGLPLEIKNFVEFIEKETECPISMLSFGPEREQTIIRVIASEAKQSHS
ncbi:adenylosuccinate synthase [Patescibacteria group bacterium]|nr:MAG: adenylosuccinate synthase [Patescibacteria group bacterium]